ncbi:hypothetical protein LJR159_005016 [Pseudomonas brassicacearum]|uniref:hypothetical protein n=1 Tax=Pseudomonas brassicacearum TaxID=930166 RepID=UPI0018AD5A1E|nr:hypothetical protein [Pseudomonas brassicacearum]
MSAAVLVQLISTCVGIIGSLFFAIGIMRQNVEAMARLSGTYWDLNPHMPPALATQKADYLFGGSLIFIAFLLQLGSFFAPTTTLLSEFSTKIAPWVAGALTVVTFFLLRFAAVRTAKYYEKQIAAWLHKEFGKGEKSQQST